jgi:hypothetical protein
MEGIFWSLKQTITCQLTVPPRLSTTWRWNLDRGKLHETPCRWIAIGSTGPLDSISTKQTNMNKGHVFVKYGLNKIPKCYISIFYNCSMVWPSIRNSEMQMNSSIHSVIVHQILCQHRPPAKPDLQNLSHSIDNSSTHLETKNIFLKDLSSWPYSKRPQREHPF